MVKNEFVKKIAERSGMTQKDTVAFLDAFCETVMQDVFAAEDSIRLPIGTFSGYTKVTNDRMGRNPLTGESLKIKGKTIKGYPKFKPSTAAKA